VDRQSRGLVSRSVSEVQRGRCALQVRVIVIPRVWLKHDRSDYFYHQRCTFLFGKPTLENSTVKRASWRAILGCVTSWEIFQAAREGGRNTPERLVVICGARRRSLKPFLITVYCPGMGQGDIDGIRATRDRELRQWMESPLAVTWRGRDIGCEPSVKRTRKLVG